MTVSENESYQQFLMDCEIISNESFSLIPGMVKRTRDRIIAYLRDHARSATTWDFTRPDVINVAQVRSALSRHRYLDLEEFLVDVPVGFNDTDKEINEYINALDATLKQIDEGYKLIRNQIVPLLGSYVNDPETFNEYPSSENLEQFGEEGHFESLLDISQFQNYFNDSRSHLSRFTDVYASNNECTAACHTLNKLNSERWAMLNPKKVKKQIDDLNTLATRVFTSLERQEKTDVRNVKIVMNAVLFAAKWSRVYAILSAKLIDATTALKHTEKKLLQH